LENEIEKLNTNFGEKQVLAAVKNFTGKNFLELENKKYTQKNFRMINGEKSETITCFEKDKNFGAFVFADQNSDSHFGDAFYLTENGEYLKIGDVDVCQINGEKKDPQECQKKFETEINLKKVEKILKINIIF